MWDATTLQGDWGKIWREVDQVKARLTQHSEVYTPLLVSEADHREVQRLLTYLKAYESQQRAFHCDVIHGDPVFSNVLLEKDNTVRFLDMRGALGSRLVLGGDAVYDLAKIYQSLLGYDYILTDSPIERDDELYLKEMQQVFRKQVAANYPRISFQDIEMVTASHFLSLIPLHKDSPLEKREKYWQMCKKILLRT